MLIAKRNDFKSFEKATLIALAMEIMDRQLKIMKQSDYHVNTITTTNNKSSYQNTSHPVVTSSREALGDRTVEIAVTMQAEIHMIKCNNTKEKYMWCTACSKNCSKERNVYILY